MFEGKGTDDESWGLDNVRVSTTSGAVAVFSAAAPTAGIAPESLAAVYGMNLPVGGVTLQVVDSA